MVIRSRAGQGLRGFRRPSMLAVPQRTGVATDREDSAEKPCRSKQLRALDEAATTRYYWGLATKVFADTLHVIFDK